ADFRQRLQVAELNRSWFLFENAGSLRQFRRGLKLALGVNNFRPAFTLGLRLLGDGALHILRNIDLFDLNLRYLDTPRLGILVKDLLQLGINLFALRQDGVQLELTDQATKSRLGQLRCGIQVILDLRERQVGIHNAEVAYRVHFYRDVVTRDHVLRRDVERFNSQRDACELVDRVQNKLQARALRLRQHSSQAQDHAALPFLNDIHGIEQPDQENQDAGP